MSTCWSQGFLIAQCIGIISRPLETNLTKNRLKCSVEINNLTSIPPNILLSRIEQLWQFLPQDKALVINCNGLVIQLDIKRGNTVSGEAEK